jgi:hypothetical protein
MFIIFLRKIDYIPAFQMYPSSEFLKRPFWRRGKTVLLTFSLVSPNKGIENVIQASEVVENIDLVYIIWDHHPNILNSMENSVRVPAGSGKTPAFRAYRI